MCCPKSIVVTGYSEDCGAVVGDEEFVSFEKGCAAVITEDADGDEGMVGQIWKDMGLTGCDWEQWESKITCVC